MTSTPFKCPPAPSETALLMHDYLSKRGLRERSEISLVMPLGVPIPPSPAASEALLVAFAERGIQWHPDRLVRELDPARKVAVLSRRQSRCPTTCSSASPCTGCPSVVEESGLSVDGWIPVNPLTLETAVPGVYAVGDVTSVGTPKAGVFAEGQAVGGRRRDHRQAPRGWPDSATYDGRGICYLEFGDDQVARVDVTFMSGQPPVGELRRARRSRSPPTRPSSAPAGSGGGSAANGPPTGLVWQPPPKNTGLR